MRSRLVLRLSSPIPPAVQARAPHTLLQKNPPEPSCRCRCLPSAPTRRATRKNAVFQGTIAPHLNDLATTHGGRLPTPRCRLTRRLQPRRSGTLLRSPRNPKATEPFRRTSPPDPARCASRPTDTLVPTAAR